MTRTARIRKTILVALAPAVLAGAACSTGNGGTVVRSDPAQTQTAVPSASVGPVDETPRPNLTDEHPLAWKTADIVSDKQIRIHFVAGDSRCYGYHAVADETPTAITVALTEGGLPEAPADCATVGRETSILVDLTSPVADRPVVQAS